MSFLKSLAREWLPPVLIRGIRQVYSRGVRLEGDFMNWNDASTRSTGYDAEEILAKVLTSTLKVKNGEAVFERDSVLFEEIEYSWPLLAGIMCAAARSEGRLNVLDFGGALGSSYFQNRKFVNSLPNVLWNVVEQPHFVEAGGKYIQDDRLRFFKSIDECLAVNPVNVVLLSSVLQYLPRPYEVLNKLVSINANTLILDRTSFLPNDSNDIIRLQHVPNEIYKASYPCHVFNEAKMCQFISDRGYQLIEKFGAIDEFDSNSNWRGHIYFKN